MIVNKPLGDPTRRSVRQDLRQHFAGSLRTALGEAREKTRQAAKAELDAIGDVRSLSPAEYRAAKRRAIVLTGRLDNPRP
jgi:hypothetical protein